MALQAYVVGGAVRDALLGLPAGDRDWVVVGATPEEMSAAGYSAVGRDFPVFLHPQTHEEYALARTERKSGRGYKGFTVYAAPDVTLEADLRRRDLTINAMARAADGQLIDPFGGQRDLQAGVLRHVSDAFVEDPVRILRVARFAARFGFVVAPETAALMQRMVSEGEADFLVAERVWQEFSRGLCEARPQAMFEVLTQCGALQRLMPPLAALFVGPHRDAALAALARAAQAQARMEERFAVLGWFAAPSAEGDFVALFDALRVPTETRELVLMAMQCRVALEGALQADARALLDLLKRADAIRRPARFAQLLCVMQFAQPLCAPTVARLNQALHAATTVDAGAAAARATHPAEIARCVDAARLAAITSGCP